MGGFYGEFYLTKASIKNIKTCKRAVNKNEKFHDIDL